jgi:general secretion pathway protein H
VRPVSARSPRGLTLIELLVVLAIVALVATMAGPALAGVTGANARKAAGELSGSMRALFDIAALRNATCRMAIDLDARTFEAECAPGPAAVRPGAAAEDEDDEELGRQFSDESDPEIRRVLARSEFGKFKDRLIPKRELPGATKFGPVHLEGRRDPVETGTAYVYFFPGGQAQRAWVPVVDGKHEFTVVTEPFTGRTRVVPGKVEVKD